MLHSFCVQPAGRLVRACAIRRYGTGPAFSRPQPARDGTASTREMLSPRRDGTGRDGPTCLTSLTFGYPFGFGSGILDFQVFRYRGVEPVRVFMYFGSGSDTFSSGSVISDRVRIFRF